MADDYSQCSRCHEDMLVDDGSEPAELCHNCAHEVVDEQKERISALEADNARLRGDIDLLRSHSAEIIFHRDALKAQLDEMRTYSYETVQGLVQWRDDRIKELEAEVERLGVHLEDI